MTTKPAARDTPAAEARAETASPPAPLSPFVALQHHDYRLLLIGRFVSTIGRQMQTVAIAYQVYQFNQSALQLGLLGLFRILPVIAFSLFGGVLADRVDRRRLLLWTTVGETVFAALLAVLVGTGSATPVGVTLLVFAGGCMTALGFPAYQAILPDLVDREDLLGASSLSLAQFNLGRVVGPALAGVVLVAGSYTWAFALNAVSYGAVVVALLTVRLLPPPPSDEPPGLWARIVAGARGARAEPGCRTAILTIAVAALLLSPFIALIPA